jgi:hypothetical protein
MADVRLVLAQSPRLYNATAWAIQMHVPSADQTVARPALMCGFAPDDLDDDPGPSLVLHGNSDELTSLTRWVSQRNPTDSDAVDIQSPSHVHYHPLLDESRWHRPSCTNRSPQQQLLHAQIVKCLVTGASLLRSVQQSGANNTSLNVTMEDYGFVRGLLQSRIIGSGDVSRDQLAVQMLSRANMYLEVKYGTDHTENNPLRATEFEYHSLNRIKSRNRELITRRELADLGNINSTTVRRLVEFLKAANDGYDQFARLGLVRRPPSKNEWNQLPPQSLTGLLTSWSMKQIRTHFDVLRRRGLITGERDHANGPWRYELPEELVACESTFVNLPTAEELEAQSNMANAS